MNKKTFDISDEIQKITRDTIHGSLFITKQAIDVITTYLDHISPNMDTIISSLQKTAYSLFKGQSSMALLFNFLNDLLFLLDDIKEKDISQFKTDIKSWCNSYKNSIENATQAISYNLSNKVPSHSLIGTYSSSETVYKAILFLHKNDKKIRVICSESRPVMEGTTLATNLINNAIPTILTTDASLFSKISTFDMVIVGVDSVYIKGVINKIGTFPLATIAKKEDVPLYALCSTKKILPAQMMPPKEPLKDSAEILANPPHGLTIENRYFDSTPLHLFTGIITENGAETPSAIQRKITTKKVHTSLQKYV